MATADFRDQLQAALGSTYTLERELGRGGMATVFLAVDAKHKRRVALKLLHPDLALALGPERFRREIELAAQLQHPHILSVHDSGETPTGLLWFTMPYVEGESLRQRLTRERQLPLEDALRIAGEAARALDYAHRHGVIHRDIKPENILLTKEGDTLVADFGIGRALGSPGVASRITETGVVVGTPAYMSPEQAAGEREIDGRTDIYSLGTVLYEMLAGEPPFTGGTAQAVIAKRMSGEIPSARRVRPSVPEPVEQTVRKSLAPVPADRFSTAGDFARALAASQHTTSAPPVAVEPPPAQPPSRPPAPPVAAIPPAAPAAHARRRVPPVFAASALSFLVGVGVLFAWRSHNASGTTSGGPVRLAVLPFDNLGDSADAYFADGLTDAVRNKLAALNGIEVIASTSSGQYRHTTKTAQQIGQELGARYLLVGKVRWARVSPTQSRVEVSPELIDATSAADKWGAPFDAPITDVFQVQADIAGKVAQQLKVALTPAVQHTLAQQPTHSLDAYDAYLHGERIEQGSAAPVALRRAVSAYEEAIELDSTFALAWAGLAITKSRIYFNGVPLPAVGDSAHSAAARALELAADLPEAHAAMGLYYQLVARDAGEALAEDSVALARAPNNVAVLRRTAQTEGSLGRWPAAVEHLRRAARLDPRAAIVAELLGRADTWLRHYPAAREELDHAFTLQLGDPSLVQDRVTVALAEGDLVGARAIIHGALATVDSASLFAYLATYYDLGWVLDSAQERVLLGLGPAAFGDDRTTRSIVFAQQYELRGDRARARVYADTARAGFEAQLKAAPNDPQRHVLLGLVLAYLGRKADAVREGERGVSLLPISKDAYGGAYNQHQLVRIYMVVGEPEKALDELEPLLKIPYYLSPAWLKIDPNFASLRGNPRFERLVSGS